MKLGDRFGHLTIVRLFDNDVKNGNDYIVCQCDCGHRVVLKINEWEKYDTCYVCRSRAYRYRTNPPVCGCCGKLLPPDLIRERYCSMSCRIKVKGYAHGDCILYGTTQHSIFNYKKIFFNKTQHYLKDLLWEEVHGEIPDGYQVMQTCNNPACVNIEHLELVPMKTIEENEYTKEEQKFNRQNYATRDFIREHFIDKSGRFLLHLALRFYGYTMSDMFIKKADLGLSNYRSSKGHVSANEAELFEWIPIKDKELSNRSVIAPYEVDILLPANHLAIEYDGIIWHSNYFKNDTVGKTQLKDQLLAKQGYTLLNVFEHENVDVWKSIILKHLGLDSPTKTNITSVKPISTDVFMRFVQHHGVNTKEPEYTTYGVYANDDLVAVFDAYYVIPMLVINRFVQDMAYSFDLSSVCRILKELHYSELEYCTKIYWVAHHRFGEQVWLKADDMFRKVDFEEPSMLYFYSNHFYSKCQAINKMKTLEHYDSKLSDEENLKRLKFFGLLDTGADVFLYDNKGYIE